jgi:hypothetical protein
LKSPIVLVQPLLKDLGERCGTSTSHDLKTIMVRSEHEGLSFLTITLPSFGADFQKSLDQGYVAHDQFLGFSRIGGLPRFLGGFLGLVFDPKSARLLDSPSIEAIRAIRQLTLMFAKIAIPCSKQRTRKSIDGWVQCEKEIRQFDQRISTDDISRYRRLGRLLWASFFTRVDVSIYTNGVLPKHGPGATAERRRGNAKYDPQLWTQRLEKEFPSWENLIPNHRYLSDIDRVKILEPGEELPVRVISVPKTLKTPRIIAIEPVAMQYMQQGVLETMMTEMRVDDNTRNFVLFDSQQPNQLLAKEGSRFGSLATLDLSEASDRVSNQHVRVLLERHAALRGAVDATRSRKADVPGHGVIRMAKFASMGSALCFPFESLVFMTVIFCGIEKALSRRLTDKDIKSFFGRVRVYGDDIIVPVEYVQFVVQELETFGFRVNLNKSYWNGSFRESCGKEYFHGEDVTISRMRQLIPGNKRHVVELVSTVHFRNHMFHRGYNHVVEALDKSIGNLIPFPVIDHYRDIETGDILSTAALLGRHDYSPSQAERHDSQLQRPLVKGVVVDYTLPDSHLDHVWALMKWFLKRGELPFEDRNHLRRAGRPVSARIKTRWLPPH